ncbi:MAG TPA: PQQ-binding-like beta-propeller repeat protein [Nitrososphaerales archaeon]
MTSQRAGVLLVLALAAVLLTSLIPPTAGSGALVNWTNTNANPQGTNTVSQGQLIPATSKGMSLAWSFSFPAAVLTQGLNVTGQGSIAPPLAVNGIIYSAMNDLEVIAIDAAKGSVLWTYTPNLNRTGLPLGTLAGHVHGLTYHSGDIWLSLPDCSAIALNSVTGQQVERITNICSGIPGNAGKYAYSGTPLVFYRDLMIWTASSVSEGTDAGRGFVAAYNITTKALVWRWYVTPPAGGDPNWDSNSCPPPCHGNVIPYHGDWGTLGTIGDRTRAGGGPGWGQPAVDAADGIVVLGTSQPSPDWNATYRTGPNLYSDSILALSLADGRLVWFYQTTPHDIYDFDCGWNVAIDNITLAGSQTTAVFKACKNGYVYAIDARTGNEIWKFNPPSLVRLNTGNADYSNSGKYNATQAWVSTIPGYEQCPGVNGGVESDISVSEGRVFVATHNFCAFITAGPVNAIGGSVSGAKGFQYSQLKANTTIYALDSSTGIVDWSYALAGIPYRGWLTTTGGLVFASTLAGDILALDASTGVLQGITHVGSPLYEGVTVGSDSAGNILAFQLTSSPSYGAFSSAVPGSLLAFAPNRQQSFSVAWLAVAGAAGVATLALVYIALGRSKRARGKAVSPG